MNLKDMPSFELTPKEGEDRRRVVEGLKQYIEAYPELRAYAVELAHELAHKERLRQETAILAHQRGRRLGRPLVDAERQAFTEGYERDGMERVVDLVLDGTADELAAWLAGAVHHGLGQCAAP